MEKEILKNKIVFESMRNNKCVFVCSIQHTGTWFMLEFFKGHKDITGLHILDDIRRRKDNFTHRSVIHSHTQYGPELTDVNTTIENIDNQYPVVFPLRDPLLAMITRNHRHPELTGINTIQILYNFEKLTKTNFPFYFPVDLFETWKNKALRFKEMENYVGISHDKQWVEKYAGENKITNTHGMHKLKKAYLECNWDKIQKAMPQEYEYLMSIKPAIVEFFKNQGYKSLPWW